MVIILESTLSVVALNPAIFLRKLMKRASETETSCEARRKGQ